MTTVCECCLVYQTHTQLTNTSNSSNGSFEFVSCCNINPQEEKGLVLSFFSWQKFYCCPSFVEN
jgi:hypothetical protein